MRDFISGAAVSLRSFAAPPWLIAMVLFLRSHPSLKVLKAGVDHFACWGFVALHEYFLPDAEYDAAIHLPLLEAIEHVIDGVERQCLDGSFHFAFGGKRESFFEVAASADDGAAQRVAV